MCAALVCVRPTDNFASCFSLDSRVFHVKLMRCGVCDSLLALWFTSWHQSQSMFVWWLLDVFFFCKLQSQCSCILHLRQNLQEAGSSSSLFFSAMLQTQGTGSIDSLRSLICQSLWVPDPLSIGMKSSLCQCLFVGVARWNQASQTRSTSSCTYAPVILSGGCLSDKFFMIRSGEV